MTNKELTQLLSNLQIIKDYHHTTEIGYVITKQQLRTLLMEVNNSRDPEKEDIKILLEKQYRKAFVQGYNAAINNSVSKKDLLSWELNGRFQNFEIWEDPINQSQIPPSVLKQNNANKGEETLEKLKKNLTLKTL